MSTNMSTERKDEATAWHAIARRIEQEVDATGICCSLKAMWWSEYPLADDMYRRMQWRLRETFSDDAPDHIYWWGWGDDDDRGGDDARIIACCLLAELAQEESPS